MEKIQGMIKGFTWIRNAVLDNPGLSSSDLMVYLVLMRYMNNKTKVCYPSIKTIMKRAGLGQRTVYRCLNNLEHLKLIYRDRLKGRSNKYIILEPPDCWQDNDDDIPF
jgi:predicted transcriptional regulator